MDRWRRQTCKHKILFVDASNAFEIRDNQNQLRPQDLARIVGVFRGYSDEDRFARIVTLAEVTSNDHNLTISRYVNTHEPEVPIDIKAALTALCDIEATRDAAAALMDELLRGLGHGT